MKCMITGGAGFIGSNLAGYLLEKNWQVVVLDDLSTGKRENLAPVLGQVEFIQGDIRDRELVARLLDGCRVVFHQAALPSVPRSIAEPELSHDVNVNGTLNLLLAARDAGIGRVVLASSSSVYGDSPVMPRTEVLAPRPLSPYAASKLAGEYYARAISAVYGLETVCLRYFNVFGPRQDPFSQYSAVIPLFIKALAAGERPTVYGDGGQSRDFTFVDHVCRMNYLAAVAQGPFKGEVFNVGCGRSITVIELLEALKALMSRMEIEPVFKPSRPGDVAESLADVSKAESVLKFEPESDFTAELTETVRWFEQCKMAL
ncbi:MAG: SDR family oxidoreductase [Gemmatimonadota bacterium]|nr:SDR family oxidoreductase [Gemmatimonadota bacterium]